MENFRSMSVREGRMQMDIYNNGGGKQAPKSMHDLRSYSTNSYASSATTNTIDHNPQKDVKIKKSKSKAASSTAKSWSFNDPELQRKKRVASYKVYAVEGKMKGSFRKSFRWIKETCSHVVHGWW